MAKLAGSISLVELTTPKQTDDFPEFSEWVNSNYALLAKECCDKPSELHVVLVMALYNQARENYAFAQLKTLFPVKAKRKYNWSDFD